jgi:hypothetical protein
MKREVEDVVAGENPANDGLIRPQTATEIQANARPAVPGVLKGRARS